MLDCILIYLSNVLKRKFGLIKSFVDVELGRVENVETQVALREEAYLSKIIEKNFSKED